MSDFDEWNQKPNNEPKKNDEDPVTFPVTESSMAEPVPSSESLSPNDPTAESLSSESKSPKKIPIWLLGVFGAGAILVLLLLLVLTIPSVSNAFKLMTSSPKNYYAAIEKRWITRKINSLKNPASSEKQTKQDIVMPEQGEATDISFQVNEDTINNMDIPELEELENIKLSFRIFTKDSDMKNQFSIKYKEETIGTLSAFTSIPLNDLYLQLEELSQSYLHVTYKEIINMIFSTENSLYLPSSNNSYISTYNVNNMEKYPNNISVSEETLKTLLNRYSSILVDSMEQVTWKKNIPLTINGVTKKTTELTVHITGEIFYNLAETILKEMEQDNDIKKIFMDNNVTESQYNAVINLIKVGLESSKESILNSNKKVEMTLWADSNGSIIGRSFSVYNNSSDPEPGLKFGYSIVKSGKQYGYQFYANGIENENSDEKFSISLSGNSEKKNQADSGNITFAFNGYEDSNFSATLNYEDFAVTNQKRGYFQGKATLSTPLAPEYQMKYHATSDGASQDNQFDLIYQNETVYTMNIQTKEIDFEPFTIPDGDIYEYSTQFNEYLNSSDLLGYLTKLYSIFPELSGDTSSIYE